MDSGFICGVEDVAFLSEYEKDGYRNLRGDDNRIVPLMRVLKPEDMEKNNADPVEAHKMRLCRRRKPRSASPVVDFLLEAGRVMKYPHMPSRQRSLFANLGGYQAAYVKDGYMPFFVIPHKSARISISAIRDFYIPDQDKVCRFVKDHQLNNIFKCDHLDISEITVYKKEFLDSDYELSHSLLESLDLIYKWFDEEPEKFPELEFILRFWRESFLIQDGQSPQDRIGNEAVIEGPVYYVALLEKS